MKMFSERRQSHKSALNRIAIMFILLLFYNVVVVMADSKDERLHAYLGGDFVIGALFPIHHMPPSTKQPNKAQGHSIACGAIREQYGIQRVEAALRTIDKINADPHLLPNITLGIEIRDDCWYAPVALQQSIELIRDAIRPPSQHQDGAWCMRNGSDAAPAPPPSKEDAKGPLVGVVSPGSSSVALQVQNLLQLFHLPQIGYSTTSKDLSDKSRYSYFLRVVPSDFFQAQVMLDIVRYYGWTYVSIVNTDENYGQAGIQAFRELAEEADVCIAREDSVLSNSPNEVFDKVIMNLRQDPNAYVVVCFCEGFTVRGLLAAAKRLNMSNHFLFIGSDGWADRSDVTQDLEEEAWGSFSVRIHSPYVKDFDSYYWSLHPATNTRDSWFGEFWEDRFECQLPDANVLRQDDDDGEIFPAVEKRTDTDASSSQSSQSDERQFDGDAASTQRLCTGEEHLSDKYRQDPKLSFVIKAILSFAYGLHNMQQDVCGRGYVGVCDKLLPFNGSLFKSYLLNVSFDYDGDPVEFDEHGDPPGRYDIMNYQRLPDGTFDYVHVGDWSNRSLAWTKGVQFGPRLTLKSVCSQECPKGHYKNIQQGGKDKRCCWVCVRCPAGEILDDSSDSLLCVPCPLGYAPDGNQTECLQLPIEYMQWLDTEAIVAMTFAACGLCATWFTLAVFIKHNSTPVVKSSTKELSYIILVGASLSHVCVFAVIAQPTRFTCTLTRLLPGVSFAMIYAALLTKTNRIARILAVSKKCFPSRKQRFMSTGAQVVITGALIAVECCVAVWMLAYQRADVAYAYHPRRTVLECNATPEGVLAPLAFDFLLIALCTLYALKTRNVPENFNEAKFIGFAMYTTCVIWIAFVPIYFGSDSKVITMSMCVTLSATVTWGFLFLPKLYIIVLHPERNHRSFFTTSKSIRCHIGTTRVSTVAQSAASFGERSTAGTLRKRDSGNRTNVGTTKDGQQLEVGRPMQRTLSCQTGLDLLQVLLLSPKRLMDGYTLSPRLVRTRVPRIIERDDCCHADECCYKKITIRLPDYTEA